MMASTEKRKSGKKRPGRGQFDPNAHAACLAFTFQPAKTDATPMAMYLELERLARLTDRQKRETIERMLMGQALSLQAMFTSWAMKAEDTKLLNHLGVYADLALRAQRQCRATLATLAEIKYPVRAFFIKNTARGHQQVNIAASRQGPISRKKIPKQANKLLSGAMHEAMDAGGAGRAIPAHLPMETVVPLNGTNHRRGQGEGQSQRAEARDLRQRNEKFPPDASTASAVRRRDMVSGKSRGLPRRLGTVAESKGGMS